MRPRSSVHNKPKLQVWVFKRQVYHPLSKGTMSAAVASAGSKRPRSALSLPTDMSWNEPSLVSGDPSSVSPLEELSRFFASTAAASGSTVNPSPEEQIYVQTASHEDAMLREPWPSAGKPSVYSRPCLFGRRCVCMRSSIEGIADCGGVVLAECMSPAEHEAFEATGAYPQTRRPCVLCARANMTDVYMHARRSVSAGSQVPGFVINWYCNPVGDDAYSKVCFFFLKGFYLFIFLFLAYNCRMCASHSKKTGMCGWACLGRLRRSCRTGCAWCRRRPRSGGSWTSQG